jgi:streptogramin lyase
MMKATLLALLLLLPALAILSSAPAALASGSCSTGTGSGPKGVVVSGSNVWIGLSSNGHLGYSTTSTCSVTSYTAQNDPTYVAFFGNGYLAFTQKTASNSCISTWDTSTNSIYASYCSGSGAGLDVVTADPGSSTSVWTTEYYNGNIMQYSYNAQGGSIYGINPSPAGCSGSNPEGIRVDTSGNVWVADERCNVLWKFVPSTLTWTYTQLVVTAGAVVTPWMIAYDSTNALLWITSSNYCNGCGTTPGAVIQYQITYGSYSNVGMPSGASQPLGIAVDSPNQRVVVAFQGGTVGTYWTSSTPQWLCNTNIGGGNPWDVSIQSPYQYWATAYTGAIVYNGVC